MTLMHYNLGGGVHYSFPTPRDSLVLYWALTILILLVTTFFHGALCSQCLQVSEQNQNLGDF